MLISAQRQNCWAVDADAWAVDADAKEFRFRESEAVLPRRELTRLHGTKRYVSAIADDSRALLDSLCANLTVANTACDVVR